MRTDLIATKQEFNRPEAHLRANNSQTQHHLSQTDKNSIRNGQHNKNFIHQSKNHSNNNNKSSNNGYTQNGHRYSEPIILKNGRSSSLPLKIMLNGTKSCHNLSSTIEKPIKSWNGTSSFFDNKTSERFSPNSLYLTYKYAQLSLSEHFLNLIEEEHKKTFLSNFSKSKLFELKNKLKKKNSIQLDEDLSFHSSHSSNIEKPPHFINSETNSDDSVTSSVEKLNMEQNGFKVQKVNSNHNLNLLRDEKSNCNDSENLANGLVSDSNNNVLNEINLNKNDQQVEIDQKKSSNFENSNNTDGNHLAEASTEHNASESTLTSMQQKENSNNSNNNDLVSISKPESSEQTSEKSSNDESKTENENDDTMVSSSEANSNTLETNSESGVCIDTTSSSGCLSDIEANNDTINNSLLSNDMSTLDEHSSSVKFEAEELSDESMQPMNELDSLCDEDEAIFRNFLPKKSCLVQKSKLFIDTSGANSESCSIMDSANATSSPLIPTSPLSPTPSNNLSYSISSFSSGSPTQSNSSVSKKKVSFADVCGKELFSVRTMSEPSNCPPKLTSKIVQYFLNREYSSNTNNMNGNGLYCRSNSSDFGYFASNGNSNNGYQKDSFFSSSRNYDYGISAVNYTNDVNQLTGSIAVYTLNFAQPAGDYLKFRRKIEENNVSLENVLLNKFQINGTIKVKNINFHKNVFVRCSFNGWKTFEDYPAQFVPCEFYTSSFTSAASASATFFGSNHAAYQPNHKEYDTFRFEFQLPKTVDQYNINANQNDPNASIQFCICYKSGASHETREFWDSNDGKNYEILQYVMDIERLKSLNQPQATTNQLRSKKKETGTKFSYNSAQESITGVYY